MDFLIYPLAVIGAITILSVTGVIVSAAVSVHRSIRHDRQRLARARKAAQWI